MLTPTAVVRGRGLFAAFLRLSVFFLTISQKPMQQGSPVSKNKHLTASPGNSVVLGLKGQRARSRVTKNFAGIDHCTFVSAAGFFNTIRYDVIFYVRSKAFRFRPTWSNNMSSSVGRKQRFSPCANLASAGVCLWCQALYVTNGV